MMLFYAILYPLILVSLSSWFIPFYRYILMYWFYSIVSLSQLSFYLSSYHTDDNRGNMYYVVSFMYFFKVIWNIDCILIYEMNLKIIAGEVTIECDHKLLLYLFIILSLILDVIFILWLMYMIDIEYCMMNSFLLFISLCFFILCFLTSSCCFKLYYLFF